ncbi:MAG: hypothetical protein ACOX2R_12420 [Anaerolineae bacterium]
MAHGADGIVYFRWRTLPHRHRSSGGTASSTITESPGRRYDEIAGYGRRGALSGRPPPGCHAAQGRRPHPSLR